MSTNMKRKSKTITDQNDIKYLIELDEETCCRTSFMMEMFGKFGGKSRFNPYDIVKIPENSYGPSNNRNKESFVTTVGLWVFNKAFIEKELTKVIYYINEPVTKGVFKKINKKLSYAVLEEKIPLDYLKHFILKSQKFQPYCNILCPSVSEKMITISKTIEPIKKELFKKYEKEIEKNDPVIIQKIEKELLERCKEELKDDPAMDIINSEAKISFGNNFKNMFVMRGAVKEVDTREKEFSVIKSNFTDGIAPEEYADFCNSLTGGPYARAKKTEVGGAQEKMFVRALAHLYILPKGSDCGTTRTIKVRLTKDNIGGWMYSFISEKGKLIELTSDNMEQYIGKEVNFRFSGLCESKKGICEKCAGAMFNRIGISEVGITTYQIPSIIKNKSMKLFHDSTVKVHDMYKYGINKIFGLD